MFWTLVLMWFVFNFSADGKNKNQTPGRDNLWDVLICFLAESWMKGLICPEVTKSTFLCLTKSSLTKALTHVICCLSVFSSKRISVFPKMSNGSFNRQRRARVFNRLSLCWSVLSLRCSHTVQTTATKSGTATMGRCDHTPISHLLFTHTPSHTCRTTAPHTLRPPRTHTPKACLHTPYCPTLPAAPSPPLITPTPSCLLALLLPLSSSTATVSPTPKEAL